VTPEEEIFEVADGKRKLAVVETRRPAVVRRRTTKPQTPRRDPAAQAKMTI